MICLGDQVRMGRAAVRLSVAELAEASGLSIDAVQTAEAAGFIDDVKIAVVLTRFFELRGFECVSGADGCGMVFRGIGKVAITEPRRMLQALADSMPATDMEEFGPLPAPGPMVN